MLRLKRIRHTAPLTSPEFFPPTALVPQLEPKGFGSRTIRRHRKDGKTIIFWLLLPRCYHDRTKQAHLSALVTRQISVDDKKICPTKE